jgi:hypothetical protein
MDKLTNCANGQGPLAVLQFGCKYLLNGMPGTSDLDKKSFVSGITFPELGYPAIAGARPLDYVIMFLGDGQSLVVAPVGFCVTLFVCRFCFMCVQVRLTSVHGLAQVHPSCSFNWP